MNTCSVCFSCMAFGWWLVWVSIYVGVSYDFALFVAIFVSLFVVMFSHSLYLDLPHSWAEGPVKTEVLRTTYPPYIALMGFCCCCYLCGWLVLFRMYVDLISFPWVGFSYTDLVHWFCFIRTQYSGIQLTQARPNLDFCCLIVQLKRLDMVCNEWYIIHFRCSVGLP